MADQNRGPDGLLPGEHKIVGVGVITQPEPYPKPMFPYRLGVLGYEGRLAEIDAFANRLLTTPLCGAMAPVIIGTYLKRLLYD